MAERGDAPCVVHLTTVHPRDDIRILHKQCRTLAAAGYRVVQVVGDGLGDARDGDVEIVDIGPRPTTRWARMWQQPRRAAAAVQRLAPDLLHFHDPELLPLAARLAARGLPVVYDAHEDVPRQVLTKQWIPAPARPVVSRLFEWYEDGRAARLAAVCAATPHIARRFARRAPLSVCVANYPFLDELAPPADDAPRERAVCYVGGITRTRGAFEMLRAIARVPGARLLLCGRFEDATLEAELRREPGWRQVDYLGQVDRQGVAEVMARSMAGLVTLQPMPSYRDAWPIKMFEYMSAALPVIASDFPLWRDILAPVDAGLCVDPLDPAAIAAAIGRLLDDPLQARAMGMRGRSAVLEHYRWDAAAAELLTLYARLLPARAGATT